MYDIFYVSKSNIRSDDWKILKSKYPTAQSIENVSSFSQIRDRAFTKMFWVIWDDVKLLDSFSLTDYRATQWDNMYVHVFKNGEHFDGICLFPKSLDVSSREFDNRFFTNKKEVDIQASIPVFFEKFYINTYDEYLEAVESTSTKMFWVIWNDIIIDNTFLFDYYVPAYDYFHRNLTHIFKNGDYFDGVCLFSKNTIVSRREFYHRFFTNKKEVDIQASIPNKYNIYCPNTYEEYQRIDDDMFWLVWPEVKVIDDTIFNLYFSHHNSYDRRENHVFKNLCNDIQSFQSGIILCSKFKQLSKKEFDNQYVVDKKEYDTVVSRFSYSIYKIENYEEYLEICKNEKQKMFWVIWPEIEIIDDTVFDLYFDPNDGRYDYDRSENHVFKNLFNTEETYTNGIALCSRDVVISEKEFTHRFIIKKKEHPRLASKMKPYEVIFISYNEIFADKNYSKLLIKKPNAKRISGIKGIHQAHAAAAKLSTTSMFWVVDADAEIVDNFEFNFTVSEYNRDQVYVWKSKNPINGLEYGYGGVKLFPKKLALEMNTDSVDMTTSISKKFNVVDEISNVTAFNTDPFSTWKSAFRECVKLSSKLIDGQIDDETAHRLDIWCSVGADKEYGLFSIAGAIAGKEYGSINKNNIEALKMINDFTWLESKFKEINNEK
jgi:hypothetical protein